MNKYFRCTACGKCCYGQLPLTWKDALANVSNFPLCLVWTPVIEGSRDFPLTRKLGVTFNLSDKRKLAAFIVPTSYIPKQFPCPKLQNNNLCSIHENKPSRCRSMPFYPYKDERFQSENLVPRAGWECDTSDKAPLVYVKNHIIDRTDFDLELNDIINDAGLMRRYADYMLKYMPIILNHLVSATSSRTGGHIVTSLSSFLTANRIDRAQDIARQQLPLFRLYAEKTIGNKELEIFHRNYVIWSKEMEFMLK